MQSHVDSVDVRTIVREGNDLNFCIVTAPIAPFVNSLEHLLFDLTHDVKCDCKVIV